MKIIENVRLECNSTGVTQSVRWEAPFNLKLREAHMILETEGAAGDNGRAKMQLSTAANILPDPTADSNAMYSAVLAEIKCPTNDRGLERPNEVQMQDWTFAEGLRIAVGQDIWLHVDSELGTAIGMCNIIFEREV